MFLIGKQTKTTTAGRLGILTNYCQWPITLLTFLHMSWLYKSLIIQVSNLSRHVSITTTSVVCPGMYVLRSFSVIRIYVFISTLTAFIATIYQYLYVSISMFLVCPGLHLSQVVVSIMKTDQMCLFYISIKLRIGAKWRMLSNKRLKIHFQMIYFQHISWPTLPCVYKTAPWRNPDSVRFSLFAGSKVKPVVKATSE